MMTNNDLKSLTPEQIAKLKEHPEILDDLAETVDRRVKHHDGKVYKAAAKLFKETQVNQINKGADKYPEPLNPDSWTMDELVNHAMEEVTDQVHYITALKIKADKMAVELELGRQAVKAFLNILDDYEKIDRLPEQRGRRHLTHAGQSAVDFARGLRKAFYKSGV